ncbi:MAG: hypothetical protein E6I43_12300 [Chloroflexi bacterium]|nr:MAG: hypothetical protein E6I43_12300 [Chloroflexota bacterium]
MKQAPWSDSRRPSNCSTGIPDPFSGNFAGITHVFGRRPVCNPRQGTGPSDYKTEDTMAKTQKWTASTFVSRVQENLTEKGHKVKKSDLSWAVKDAFEAAVAAGARGMRVRFPEIGALASRDVKARKAGKGTNPFTGESIMLKARPASKKPRWSFPKAVREAYIRQAARKAA